MDEMDEIAKYKSIVVRANRERAKKILAGYWHVESKYNSKELFCRIFNWKKRRCGIILGNPSNHFHRTELMMVDYNFIRRIEGDEIKWFGLEKKWEAVKENFRK